MSRDNPDGRVVAVARDIFRAWFQDTNASIGPYANRLRNALVHMDAERTADDVEIETLRSIAREAAYVVQLELLDDPTTVDGMIGPLSEALDELRVLDPERYEAELQRAGDNA